MITQYFVPYRRASLPAILERMIGVKSRIHPCPEDFIHLLSTPWRVWFAYIARERGVDGVVEGTVVRSGDQVRMTAQYLPRPPLKPRTTQRPTAASPKCYSMLSFSIDVGSMATNEAEPKALEAAQQAIRLDDSSAEAHTSLAFIKLHYEWDLPGAAAEFRRAFALNPGAAKRARPALCSTPSSSWRPNYSAQPEPR